jgi:two-component system, LytTR family, response regulator
MRRVLIADDEPLARQRVRRLLKTETDAVVVGESTDGPATVEEIRRLAPDVLFLDVEMPGLDGFEVLAAAAEPPVVVFVTAFAEYAVPAFDTAAADYLLKPIEARRFRRAWRRVGARLDARAAAGVTPSRSDSLRRFLVARGEGMLVVNVSDVRWLEAQDNYVALHTGTAVHLVRGTLSALEARLDPHEFARIRRSTIVNCRLVQEMARDATGQWYVVLRTGERLRVGDSHRAAFFARLRGAPPG